MAAHRPTRSLKFTTFLAALSLATAGMWGSAAAQTPLDRFTDDDRSVHEGAIDAIAAAGITTGCNPPRNDRYCPDRLLTRGEMATMLVGISDITPRDGTRFKDLSNSVHKRNVEGLAAAAITNGCNPPDNDRFCPDDILTRGQMAAFLVRTLGMSGPRRDFVDTNQHMFGREIGILGSAGVTKGCNPPDNDRFCPERPVTRGEVATFLARALGLEVIANTANDGSDTPPTATPPTTRPPSDPAGGAYPGQPAPGTVLWGAAVGQNDDPVPRHEVPSGANLSLRRTFYQWNHRVGYMIDTAAMDLRNGRLPWVSIKTPGWAQMASGSLDHEIDAMLRALDGLNGPVWLTVHHEPEGGGGVNAPDDSAGPAGHLAMNRRVRERMTALGVDNIALAPILMDWTWDPRSGRNPDQWWDSSVYDFLGVDHYVCDSAAPSCEDESLVNEIWTVIRAWAAREGVDIAVGEWGMRGTDSEAGMRLEAWYEAAARSHSDGLGARVVGLAAFDSAANVAVSYELKGSQLEVFHQLMRDNRTADPTN